MILMFAQVVFIFFKSNLNFYLINLFSAISLNYVDPNALENGELIF